jgi:hypothetical protein
LDPQSARFCAMAARSGPKESRRTILAGKFFIGAPSRDQRIYIHSRRAGPPIEAESSVSRRWNFRSCSSVEFRRSLRGICAPDAWGPGVGSLSPMQSRSMDGAPTQPVRRESRRFRLSPPKPTASSEIKIDLQGPEERAQHSFCPSSRVASSVETPRMFPVTLHWWD